MGVCLRVLVKSNGRKLLALGVTWQVWAVRVCLRYSTTRKALFLNKKQEEEGRFSPFAHAICRIPNIPIGVPYA